MYPMSHVVQNSFEVRVKQREREQGGEESVFYQGSFSVVSSFRMMFPADNDNGDMHLMGTTQHRTDK